MPPYHSVYYSLFFINSKTPFQPVASLPFLNYPLPTTLTRPPAPRHVFGQKIGIIYLAGYLYFASLMGQFHHGRAPPPPHPQLTTPTSPSPPSPTKPHPTPPSIPVHSQLSGFTPSSILSFHPPLPFTTLHALQPS